MSQSPVTWVRAPAAIVDPLAWPVEYYAIALVVVTTVLVLGILVVEYVYLTADRYRLEAVLLEDVPEGIELVARSDERLAGLDEVREVVDEASEAGTGGPVGVTRARNPTVRPRLDDLPLVEEDDEEVLYVETADEVVRVEIADATDSPPDATS